MPSNALSVEAYLQELPQERREAMEKLRNTILQNLPPGFEEAMSYGMIGYGVPHRLYPRGYHCSPQLPLPFVSIAAQKNFIAIYHMGIYADDKLLKWFLEAYKKATPLALDMGKSCIRFKKPDQIPLGLIAKLMQKITVPAWIRLYEKKLIPKGAKEK